MVRSPRKFFVPRSRTTGNVWPAIPNAGCALDFALLYQLERSEWLPEAALRDLQKAQVLRLLEHAWRTVPYYRERDRGFDVRTRDFWNDCWPEIPILSRSDVQAAERRLVSEALPKDHGSVSTISTSGSTGRPVRTLTTDLTRRMWRAFSMRDHLWHGRDFSQRFAAIRSTGGLSAEPPHGFTTKGWDAVYGVGTLHALSVQAPIDAQIGWLQSVRPAYLLSYPSNLRELARRCVEQGIRLEGLQHVVAVGEVVTPECRRLAAEAWGVGVKDAYTSQEAGYLALQCPETEDCYHVQSENVVLEVIDEAGRPCGEGEVGRVVVTTMHNFATPLIRYDIGDYAEMGGTCRCGRGLPVLRRIFGRRRNMLTLPDGNRRWPFLGEYRYRDVAPVRQYQIVQKSLELIEVVLAADRPLTSTEESKLSEIIRAELGYPFELSFVYVDEIPRSPSGKFEDFRSELSC